VEIKGANLAPAGDIRTWQSSDFVGGKMPIALDGVSVTVNGKAAFVYYISPTQINILTPPDALTGNVQVVVTAGSSVSAAYQAQAAPTSPSFFVINGGPYVVAQHAANYSLVGPVSLYPGQTTPAKPGETIVLYANGFGPTTQAVVSGSATQSGNLSPPPIVTIGGIQASVQYAALISPGLFQLNVVVPLNVPAGDNLLAATSGGVATYPVDLLTVQGSGPATSSNFYVAPNGNDSWSGALASPNPAGTDGPFATFDHAREAVAALNESSLTQVTVQFRGGTYYLPATVQFSAADSGTAATSIVYTNYPSESPIFRGGMGWTNTSGDTWTLTPPLLAQTAAPDLRGIYIYTNDVSQITAATGRLLQQSFSIPGVDGVAVAIGWNAIEPSMGQYDWTLLDQWIGQVSALGKKIDLVVPAGVATPAWLFQAAPAGAGASPLNFTITPHGGQTDQCQPETIAAPWDPAFLSQWDAMLVALAAHLKTAGTYSAVTLVRLTGINRTTEELRLPAETAQSTGLACVTNAIVTWQQAGYRPSLLLQGWNAILGSFLKSFPDKTFAVSIIPNGAFPAIDDSGAAIAGTPPDQDLPLLTSASQKLPGRLVVQFDFLMPGEQASAVTIGYATKLNTFLAFQTNEYAGGSGAACSEPVSNPTPCIDSTFLTLLQTGIYPSGQSDPLRPQYIEVFHDNAAAFPGDILTAHGELLPPGIAKVANAEGESPTIAPNTWVEIKGSGLSLTGDSRIWQTTDFVGNQLPTQLDGVSATVNGKPAYLYYISPSQVNILTPPDAIPGAVQVVLTNNGAVSASFTAAAQALSPSFFVFDGTHLAAAHLNGSYVGPTSLYAGLTTPAKPGELVLLFGNGFGPTSAPVVSGSITQGGTLMTFPAIQIGGITASVQYAGLSAPGEYQFNVYVPASLADGEQPVTASYGGLTTQTGAVLTVHH